MYFCDQHIRPCYLCRFNCNVFRAFCTLFHFWNFTRNKKNQYFETEEDHSRVFFMCSMFSGLWESEHEIQSTMHNVDWNEYRWWKMHKLQKLRSRKPSQPIKQNDSLQSINELLLSVVIFSPLDLMFSVWFWFWFWFGFGLVWFDLVAASRLIYFNSILQNA